VEHDACSEEDLQLQRLMERNAMSEAKAKKRISTQMSLERKCEQAHFVVENSGTIQDTREQVCTYRTVTSRINILFGADLHCLHPNTICHRNMMLSSLFETSLYRVLCW